MKKWLISLLLIILCSFAKVANGQVYTQTFIDKCTGQTKVATTTMVNGNAIVSFYGQIKTFTPAQVIVLTKPIIIFLIELPVLSDFSSSAILF